jgi:hypothetical protein
MNKRTTITIVLMLPALILSILALEATHPIHHPLTNFHTHRCARSVYGSTKSSGFHCSTERPLC